MAFVFGAAQTFSDPQHISMCARVFAKQGRPVVFVPLGKALHAGHRALIRAAKTIPGAVVFVSITSDDTQDHELLREEKVDVVFRFSTDTLWENGLRTMIRVTHDCLEPRVELETELTSIVTLLNIIRPSDIFLGEKDYELLLLVQRMISDFHLGVKVHSIPIVRTHEGVAMSLRNAAVAESERAKVLALSAALTAGAHVAEQGKEAIIRACEDVLAAAGVTPEYVQLRSVSFGDAPDTGDGRLLVAAVVAGVRLLDNVGVPIGIGFRNLDQ
ncbi:pantoate--beta-alanine ligase [Corynebacterium sp. sy017]|uniref:pantoate--beta-alanine ligase n=1 Tax=unclassified Corynebacterium TaxID=2624378 RepID=UPI001185BB6A|nr:MULTISPECIES: pantoate--beta-alanine ligase [unclassified Corynebacterium]MBP3088571.1 pantoate--beta-alanine ligase [Corynebacterium sp. sy017]TSD91868.1 pantoate--beta-alanine ligase [Corynebacterium sp. SY003]